MWNIVCYEGNGRFDAVSCSVIDDDFEGSCCKVFVFLVLWKDPSDVCLIENNHLLSRKMYL